MGAPRRARGCAPPLLLESGADSELQLTRRFLGEGEGRDALHRAAPFGEDVDQPPDELGRLAGARRRLNDQRLIERCPDTVALGLIREVIHGQLLSARSGPSGPWSFRAVRRSSCGPQISRKSQIPQARSRGAGGKNPRETASSIAATTSTPRRRVAADIGTTRCSNSPARVA